MTFPTGQWWSDHFFNFISFQRRPRRASVRKSLLGWLGLMWLLTVIISTASSGYYSYTLERMLWQSRLHEELANASHSMMDFVARAQMLMHFAGQLDNKMLTSNPQLLNYAINADDSLLELVKIDADGNIIAAIHQDRAILADTFTIPQAQWFRSALEGNDYYSDVQYSFQDTPYLILTVQGDDGGVVAARLRMDVLQAVVGELGIGKTGRIYIADENGNIMAHVDKKLVGANLQEIDVFNAIQNNSERTWQGEYVDLHGDKVLGATLPIAQANWLLVAEVLQSEAYAVSRTNALASGAVVLLLSLIVMFANARFFSRLIFQPLERLRAGTERLSEGHYGYRLQHARNDEVGVVADAFNALALALQRRDADINAKTSALNAEIREHEHTQEELEELNSTLEQRIGERTARLENMTHELRRSNQALEEFAYVASHDLQEPLRKVRTFGDRLVDRCGSQLDERGRDYLARMQNGASRMQGLIDDLLAYSRVTTKAQPVEPVDLDEVLRSVLSDLEVRIESLHAEVQAGALGTILADASQMRQLLQNLVGNALKFHQPGLTPCVQIQGRWLPGDTQNGGSASPPLYELTVADNGIGFEMQYAERIFQVFQRLHGRSEYEGTGVGLAICRKIVERHGGVITAAGAPDAGAIFTVRLPAAVRPLKTAEHEDEKRGSNS